MIFMKYGFYGKKGKMIIINIIVVGISYYE